MYVCVCRRFLGSPRWGYTDLGWFFFLSSFLLFYPYTPDVGLDSSESAPSLRCDPGDFHCHCVCLLTRRGGVTVAWQAGIKHPLQLHVGLSRAPTARQTNSVCLLQSYGISPFKERGIKASKMDTRKGPDQRSGKEGLSGVWIICVTMSVYEKRTCRIGIS